jgi:hypothetical protein
MKNLLGKLQKAGKLHERGEFTLDVEAAGSKMARFQFRDEAEFLKHLVAGLFRIGATEIRVHPETTSFRVEVKGVKLPARFASELPLNVLDEASPLRRLAAACQAILGHRPAKFRWKGAKPDQLYDLCDSAENHWPALAVTEVQVTGFSETLLRKACDHLRLHGLYSRRPLYVGRTQLHMAKPREESKLGRHTGHFYLDRDLSSSQLLLVVDEILTESKALQLELPWHGVYYWNGAPPALDAALSAVVENDEYEGLLAQIPSTFHALLPEALKDQDRLQNPKFRGFLCDLLRRSGDTAWLQAARFQIRNLPLLQDHQGKPWSITALLALRGPVYHAPIAPPQEIVEVILVEADEVILATLAAELGDNFQEASPVVINALLRGINQRRWAERKQEPLRLPPDDWLIQRGVQLEQGPAILGIAADWAEAGGHLYVYHQGKFLVQRKLHHQETAFAVALEIDASAIDELWKDLTPEAFSALQSRLVSEADGLLKEMIAADTSGDLGPARLHLLKHLAAASNPASSYFAKTLLFRDVDGKPHSLHSLLTARGEGRTIAWVGKEHPPLAGFPDTLLPPAVWVVGEEEVWDCLARVNGLSAKNLTQLLADLVKTRTGPTISWGAHKEDFADDHCKGTLQIQPSLGQGRVHLCVDGHWVDPVMVPSHVAYEATLYSSRLKFNVRLDAHALVERRWTLISNQQAWKKCQSALAAAATTALQKLSATAPEKIPTDWYGFVEHVVLLGWGNEYPGFLRVPCLLTWPQPSSLEQVLQAGTIYWSVAPLEEQQYQHIRDEFGDVLVWPKLTALTQAGLAAAYPQLAWHSIDAWLASQEQLKEFLRLPILEPTSRGAMLSQPASGRLSGTIGLYDPEYHTPEIAWTHLQRSVWREGGHFVPQGMRAILESSELQPNETFQRLGPPELLVELRQAAVDQFGALLEEFLQQPRPEREEWLKHWLDWVDRFPSLQSLLRNQPWFRTSAGSKSWSELENEPRIYRLDTMMHSLPPDDLFVLESSKSPKRLLDSLFSQHPEGVNSKASAEYVQGWQKMQQRDARLQGQRKRLARYAHKIELQAPLAGELAYAGEDVKEAWMVLSDRVVKLENVPSGLIGFVVHDDHKIRKIGTEEVAELPNAARKALLTQLAPMYIARMVAGGLKDADLRLVTAYLLSALQFVDRRNPGEPWNVLVEARWLPLADGTRTSLAQLRLEAEERQGLTYWRRTYKLAPAVVEVTPILHDHTLVQLVKRWTGHEPALRPPPLLYQDVLDVARQPIGTFRQVLQGLGDWVSRQNAAGLRLLESGQSQIRAALDAATRLQASADQKARALLPAPRRPRRAELSEAELRALGAPLLTELRRQASVLLTGVARRESLKLLDRARWTSSPAKDMWLFPAGEPLQLNAQHPRLKELLLQEETPQPAVVLSLLLGLVSAINARTEPFTDAMESAFLHSMLESVVDTYRDHIPSP